MECKYLFWTKVDFSELVRCENTQSLHYKHQPIMLVVHQGHRVHLPKQNNGTKCWLTNKMQIQPYKLSDWHAKNASRTGRSEVSALLVEGGWHSLSLLCRRVWTWNLPSVLSKLFGLVFHFVSFVYKFILQLMWTYLIWTFCTFMLFIRRSWALKIRLDISWDCSSPSDAFQHHIFVNIRLQVQKPHCIFLKLI